MLNLCRLVKVARNGVRPQIVIMTTDEVGEIGIINSKRLLFLDKVVGHSAHVFEFAD